MKFLNKFKIPTFLGLTLILIGLGVGLYLIIKEQAFLAETAPNLTPKNITVTNITEEGATISWQTVSETTSLVSYGQQRPGEQTAVDDRDNSSNGKTEPKSYVNHYVTLKNLLPQTVYQFKIISGKIVSPIKNFQTASPAAEQNTFSPVIGSVLELDGNPLSDGIIYLSIPGSIEQSFLIKSGSFLIPLSKIRTSDLSAIFQPVNDMVANLVIRTGDRDTKVIFKLKENSKPLPPITVGEYHDFTQLEELPSPSPDESDIYDLNLDGKINAADYAIVLLNLGKKAKDKNSEDAFKKSDLNKDGVVDKKDLDLLNQKLKDLSSP